MINKFGLYVVSKKELSNEKYTEVTDLLKNNKKFTQNSKYAPTIINVLWEHSGFLFMPRQFGLRYIGPVKQNLLSSGDPLRGTLIRNEKIKLWPHQIEAVNIAVANYNRGGFGGLLKIACGKGKTFTMLELIVKIGKRTLIIVDKTTLAEDWLRETKIYYPSAIAARGMAQGTDINIMVINSIYLGKLKPDDYVSFGLVIIDEVHNTIGQKILNVFRYISRRYIVGISGTPTRADRLEYMLSWYIGPILYSGTIEYNGAAPIVHMYHYLSTNAQFTKIMTRKDGTIDPTGTLKNTMINDVARRHFLVKIIVDYHKQFDQLLVIGLYRDQLEGLMMELGENGITFGEIGIYYGGLNKIENEMIRTRKIILGMRKMCAESLNIPELRCIILASSYKPANNGENTEKFEQQLHRIMRKDHIAPPMIVDITDNYGFFIKHSRLRRNYYKDHKFIIKKIN